MDVEIVDGVYIVYAPWLDEPVSASSWESAYELANRGRFECPSEKPMAPAPTRF